MGRIYKSLFPCQYTLDVSNFHQTFHVTTLHWIWIYQMKREVCCYYGTQNFVREQFFFFDGIRLGQIFILQIRPSFWKHKKEWPTLIFLARCVFYEYFCFDFSLCLLSYKILNLLKSFRFKTHCVLSQAAKSQGRLSRLKIVLP